MNLLNEDNVVHVFLNKLGDIVIANLLFILCCIPVITIGPSLTALLSLIHISEPTRLA